MKKVALLLLMAGFMFTASNLYSSITTVSAKVAIGNYSDKDDFCPNKGDGCIHLDPVIIVVKKK